MWREWSSAKLCVFEILCVYIILQINIQIQNVFKMFQ